jgi:hypothetical protein
MPPPVTPQGSRTGLITAFVIFAVAFVVMAVLYINENATLRRTRQELDQNRTQLAQVASSDVLTNAPAILATKDEKAWANDPNVSSASSALGVAIAQRDRLAQLVAGTNQAAGAIDQANRLMAALSQPAAAGAGGPATQPTIALPANASLTQALRLLNDRVQALQQENGGLNDQLAQARNETQQAIKEREAILAAQEQKLKDVQNSANNAIAELAAYRETADKGIQTLTQGTKQELGSLQRDLSTMQQTIAQRDEQIRTLKQSVAALTNKLQGQRVDPTGPVVRQADGRIIRVPGDKTVYIDLGQGDQVIPGMTFEVYDRFTGIPQLPAGDEKDDKVQGKASIEVVKVGAASSEAIITRQTRGDTLREGDVIGNVIYDRNTKYNFVVHGNFDLDSDKVAAPGDAEIIKRLITQWGGQVADQVNADTDFVVIGKEPEVQTLPENPTPEQIAANQRAQAERKAYDDLLTRAGELNIPILNQNRFLHLIGYYNQAGR